MKRVYAFFVMKLVILLVLLAIFFVKPQAKLFTYDQCNDLSDNKYQLKRSDYTANPISEYVTFVSEKYRRNTEFNPKTSLSYSALPVVQQPTEDETDYFEGFRKLLLRKDDSEKERVATESKLTRMMSEDKTLKYFSEVEEYDKLITTRDNKLFLNSLMASLKATAKYTPLEGKADVRIKEILSLVEKGNIGRLKTQLDTKLRDKTQVLSDSKNCLPDFFVTDAFIFDNPENPQEAHLAERRTEYNINRIIERVEKRNDEFKLEIPQNSVANIYSEVLYLIIRTKTQDEDELVIYPLVVSEDSFAQDAAVYLFNESASILYELPGKELGAVLNLYEQWGEVNNRHTGVYSLVNTSTFVTQQSYQESGFTHQTLQTIISHFNKCHHRTKFLRSVIWGTGIGGKSHTALFSCLREKVSDPDKLQNVHDSFLFWYKREWFDNPKSDKAFLLGLSGVKAANNGDAAIIVAPLNNNVYAITLLQSESDDGYFLLPKICMGLFAKQLMFISDDITVYEFSD